MKILIYSHFFPPETGAASIRMRYLAEALKPLGAEVRIINPVPNYPNGKTLSGIKRFFYRKDNITFLPIYVPRIDSPIKRLLSYLTYFFSSLIYSLVKFRKHDFIISSSPPIITALAAAILSKIKGSIFILDIRDIWPDIGIELGIIKSKHTARILFSIEKFIVSKATKITVTAEGDKKNLVKKGVSEKKITVIYNGADTRIFKPSTPQRRITIRKRFNLPISKKILVYFGSFNQGMNDIDILIDSLKQLENFKELVHFVAIGNGSQKEKLLNNIKGYISYSSFDSSQISELAEIISACDLSLIPRKFIKKDTGGNIPVKCFESWAAGIPVMVSTIKDTEIMEIVLKSKAGFIVEPGKADIFANKIKSVIVKQNLEKYGKNGRKYVEENFDRNKLAKDYLNLLLKITFK
ncbi:putative glycosyl transferase [bacterium BMS3Abin04]|nr:putative glycosyl transferase [bacterium BMS3Abin04]